MFYVVSRPLTLETAGEELRVVLEIVSHVSDRLLLEKAACRVPFGGDPYRTIEADLGYAYTERFRGTGEFLAGMLETARPHPRYCGGKTSVVFIAGQS